MNQAIFVDTNILFDFWVKNLNTEQARILLVDKKEIYVTRGVLYELFTLLKNELGVDKACAVLDLIYTNEKEFFVIDTTSQEEQESLEIAKKYQSKEAKKSLSLVDAILLVQARNFSLPLFTLDERMTFYAEAEVIKPY